MATTYFSQDTLCEKWTGIYRNDNINTMRLVHRVLGKEMYGRCPRDNQDVQWMNLGVYTLCMHYRECVLVCADACTTETLSHLHTDTQ